ncbi:hypothetical protein B7Y92_02750 [Candidatus Saccharibacteria bacterium 32-50-13]|nr:MAG: hypothetical protein B7Y92_02750 [Candidatus Saccharibacteria bacterium 32-50-13]
MNTGPNVIAKATPFHYIEGQLLVALTSSVGVGSPTWSLPETPVYYQHTSLQSLEQMLRTQCGLTPRNVRYREQLYAFELPAADSSSRSDICLTYLYVSPELLWHKGTKHIGLFPIERLPQLSTSDHQIMTYALERLRSKALYTTLPAFLLPKEFSLSAYQQVFETLTGRTVDKRNFRKKLLALDVLSPVTTGRAIKRGDTQLYQLQHQDLIVLPKPF